MMLLRISEVAKMLGLEESTIRKWVLLRRIPVVRLGRSVRVQREQVERMIREGERPALNPGGTRG